MMYIYSLDTESELPSSLLQLLTFYMTYNSELVCGIVPSHIVLSPPRIASEIGVIDSHTTEIYDF